MGPVMMMMMVIVMETTKKRKQANRRGKGDDDVWRSSDGKQAKDECRKNSKAGNPYETNQRANTSQGSVANPPAMESEIKAQSHIGTCAVGACAHLRPNVHHIAWIMS